MVFTTAFMLLIIIELTRFMPDMSESYLAVIIVVNIITFSAVKVGTNKFKKDRGRIPKSSEIFRFIFIEWIILFAIVFISIFVMYTGRGQSILDASLGSPLDYSLWSPLAGVIVSSIAPWVYLRFLIKPPKQNI